MRVLSRKLLSIFLLAPLVSGLGTVATVLIAVASAGVGIAFLTRGRIRRLVVPTVLFVLVLVVSGLFAGSLPTSPRGMTEFLAGEGRLISGSLVLLFLGTAPTAEGMTTHMRRYLRLAVYIHIPMMIAWRAGQVDVIGLHLHGGGNFGGLASSHHVIGMYFGIAFIVLIRTHNRRDWRAGLLCVPIIILSGSRTTIVALIAVGLYEILKSDSLTRRLRLVGGGLLLGVLALTLSQRLVETSQLVGSGALFAHITTGTSQTAKGLEDVAADPNKTPAVSNVLRRIGLWEVSWQEFARSPLVGIGGFRLNDTQKVYRGLSGVAVLANEGEHNHSDSSAHNVILQIISEVGLVGVALFVWAGRTLWRDVGPHKRNIHGPADFRIARGILVFMAGTMLTSNAVLSPGLLFPGFAVIGALLLNEPGRSLSGYTGRYTRLGLVGGFALR